MTAVISSGTSPFSAPDEDEDSQSWQFIHSSSAGSLQNTDMGSYDDAEAGDILLFNNNRAVAPSPSIMSHGSWGIVGYAGQQQHQQQQQGMGPFTTPSPVLSHHRVSDFSAGSYSPAMNFGAVSAADISSGDGSFVFDFGTAGVDMSFQPSQQPPILGHAVMEGQGQTDLLTHGLFPTASELFSEPLDLAQVLPEPILGSFEDQDNFGQQSIAGIPLGMRQDATNVHPWTPTGMHNIVYDSGHNTAPESDGSRALSREVSPRTSERSVMPGEAQNAVHEIPKKSSRVQKLKRKSKTPPRVTSPDRKLEDGFFKFCNQTPDTFGKASFGDMEHLDRSSQKGRKGALSDEVRASALNVRKQGACFCCHIRKVKCDEQRPCKSCVKFCTQVPYAACWKFSEFTTILFPSFLSQHFEKTEMSRFVEDNVASFTLNGVDTPLTVTLSSGDLFRSKLTVKAKFFTPRAPTSEVMQHWHNVPGEHGVEIERIPCAPLCLDTAECDAGGSLRAELKRKIMSYMEALTEEEGYPAQLNDIIKTTTEVPMLVLQLVQKYAQQAPEADASIVRRMLGILVLQHVMTRHLTLTFESIVEMQRIYPLQLTRHFLTSRLLSRQIKQVVEECLKDLVPMLFDDFLKRLKSKSRKEWAPCMASFLVFCLLMELTEATSDSFAIAEAEIEMRKRNRAKFIRAKALEVNRQIENMPFRQFAYQFHQIYQTHSQDASAKSFNPLQDNARSDMWELEPAAMEFVKGLREHIDGNFPKLLELWREESSLQCTEDELDWLTFDPILLPDGAGEDHPYPRDVSAPYMGRLVAKFLLSFKDRSYLFTGT